MTAQSVRQIVIVPIKGVESVSLPVLCGVALLRLYGGYEHHDVLIDPDIDQFDLIDQSREYLFEKNGVSCDQIQVEKNSIFFFRFVFLTHLNDVHIRVALKPFKKNFEQYILNDRCDEEWQEMFASWKKIDSHEALACIEKVLQSIANQANENVATG